VSALDSWHSYPSIFALGHRALTELFLDDVLVEEKVDGSQFSFGCFLGEDGPYLRCRSKGAELNLFAPEKMFLPAIETMQALAPLLTVGWTYRGEFLAKPRHNALMYERVPARHLILFDINSGHEAYLPWEAKAREAERLGLEVVPRLFRGQVTDADMFRSFLDRVSVLGGQKVEGVVVKNYARFGPDKKVLMGKFVSEAFKETHAKMWKADNPNSGDIIDRLTATYHSQARWQKAVQHLKEAGALVGEPKDIAALFREVPEDIERECMDEIKDKLWEWAWPRIRRGTTVGLAEWYKERLLAQQFEQTETAP